MRLVVFDLDGTLLRRRTICEVVADGLGRTDRMRALEGAVSQPEVVAAREEMATWYRDVDSRRGTGDPRMTARAMMGA